MSYEWKTSDIFDFAHAIGADVRQKGNELFFRQCPRCHGGQGRDRDTFSINLDTGAFKCFRASCDYHGHFIELLRDFGFPLDTVREGHEADSFRHGPMHRLWHTDYHGGAN